MFEFFKNIFVGKPVENETGESEPAASVTASHPREAAAKVVAAPRPESNGNGLHIPLQAVLNGLPLELKTRIKQSDVGDASLSIPLEKVLSQLSQGAVRVAFGDLRRAAPQIFSSQNDRDRIQVALPLEEILPQLNPSLLLRRQDQKRVEVPDEISSPFGSLGQGLVFSVSPAKPATPPAPRAVKPAGATLPKPGNAAPLSARSVQPRPIRPTPLRSSLPSPSTAPPPSASPAGPPPTKPSPSAFHGAGAAPFAPQEPSIPRAPAPPNQPKVPPSRRTGDHSGLSIPLTTLAESWPGALRQEIVRLSLVDAKVVLPVGPVEEALKRGKISFSWKLLRSWIRPAPLPAVSAHDDLVLELPLKVVAPMFLTGKKEAVQQKQKVAIDESIPNLFFGFPQGDAPTGGASVAPGAPAATGAPAAPAPYEAAKPVDTNYYVWDDAADTARVDETEFKRRPSLGTTFLTRYATPNEVVSRAAALDGVVGALIALPDGLMVASRLSPDLNGDTLAAFLPHIFGKVSQCTKELRMGELNNLNFTVGNIPWKIFRVNAIFFAAFGHVGQGLPTAQLAALAAELDRKKQ